MLVSSFFTNKQIAPQTLIKSKFWFFSFQLKKFFLFKTFKFPPLFYTGKRKKLKNFYTFYTIKTNVSGNYWLKNKNSKIYNFSKIFKTSNKNFNKIIWTVFFKYTKHFQYSNFFTALLFNFFLFKAADINAFNNFFFFKIKKINYLENYLHVKNYSNLLSYNSRFI